MNLNKYLDVKPEVAQAIAQGKPVVALESTIISHGMPYPQNVETALNVEKIIRENGAVPATIAIIGGRLKAGLTPEEIEYFGKKGQAIAKASRRDLAVLCARGEDGATTVTTTMIIAHMAGIRVFATGGIGGVHRGAETTMDISADLEELAHTPVMVVCAGAKSILDLGLTLEYLETHGGPGGRHGGGASGGPHRGPGHGDCPGEGPGAGCGGPAGGRKSLRRPAPAPDHCPSPDPATGDSDSGRQRLSPGLCHGCQAPGRHRRSAQSPYHLCGFAAGGVHSPCRLDSGTG